MATGLVNINPFETGIVDDRKTVNGGSIAVHKYGVLCFVKIYVRYSANIAANDVVALLPWKPVGATFSVIMSASSSTPMLAQLNTNGSLQINTAVSANQWLEGQLTYFTND